MPSRGGDLARINGSLTKNGHVAALGRRYMRKQFERLAMMAYALAILVGVAAEALANIAN